MNGDVIRDKSTKVYYTVQQSNAILIKIIFMENKTQMVLYAKLQLI